MRSASSDDATRHSVGTSTRLKGATIVYLTHTSGGNCSLNGGNTDNIAKRSQTQDIPDERHG